MGIAGLVAAGGMAIGDRRGLQARAAWARAMLLLLLSISVFSASVLCVVTGYIVKK